MTHTFLQTTLQDVRYALRTMRQKPLFALTAVLTMALAIGGNTAMFSVIRAVLLKPLEYRDPNRLVRISGGATTTRFVEAKAGAKSFAGIAAFSGQENLTLAGGPEPEVLKAARVSAGWLRVLGVDPLLGRDFSAGEDAAGGAPVALISAGLWKRRFAADPAIVGRTITLASAAYTVIGVLPQRLQFPFPGLDVWLTAPSEWPVMTAKSRALSPFLTVFGRLQPGSTLAQANAEMTVLRRQYKMAHPTMLDAKAVSPSEVRLLQEELVANVRSLLWLLFGAVGFVLLIACANVASLLLARAASRSREFAVRSALGATRTRLIRQMLVESVVLSVLGGVLGLLFASWTVMAVPSMAAVDLPRAGEIELDGAVLGFAVLLSVVTGAAFGLVPSIGASRPDLIRVLRATGNASGTSAIARRFAPGLTLRGLLLVGQVALSTVLLVGVALLIESVNHLRHVEVGFNPENLLTMRLSLPSSRYDTDRKAAQFFEDLVGKAGRVPGVRSAAAALFLPMMGYAGTPVQDAAKPLLPLNERSIANILIVTPGYFRTLGIPLRRGRDFAGHDRDGAERVTIIDEAAVRRFWPEYPRGLDPIGQRLWIGGINPKPAQIIGIAASVHQNLENTAWPETVYTAFAQNPQPSSVLAIRTDGDPLRYVQTVRRQVRELDPDLPVAAIRTMADLMEQELGQRRLLVTMLGAFASVALLLTLIGLYGLVAYSAEQRVQEIGIRQALGAQHTDIVRLLVGHGVRLALAGVTAGLLGAFALTRMLGTLLFQVSATDPATFGGIALLLVLVAIAASYVPARRATQRDPMTALRT